MVVPWRLESRHSVLKAGNHAVEFSFTANGMVKGEEAAKFCQSAGESEVIRCSWELAGQVSSRPPGVSRRRSAGQFRCAPP